MPEGVIWLRDCSGVAVTPLDQIYDSKKFPFNVVGPLRVHSFYAKSESDQNLWAKLILTAIQDFRSTERPETSDETSTGESLGEKSRRHSFAVPSLKVLFLPSAHLRKPVANSNEVPLVSRQCFNLQITPNLLPNLPKNPKVITLSHLPNLQQVSQ